jgi:ribosomal protein S18 acetylase RimI-like enzyme
METLEATFDNRANDEIGQLEQVVQAINGMDINKPVLGVTDDIVVAPSFRDMVLDPNHTIVVLREQGTIVGFSLAIPIGEMDPSRTGESVDTAYIYYTAIEPTHQGQGYVGQIMDQLIASLRQKGYRYIERDAVIANGYADKIEKRYGDAIVTQYDHNHFPEFGPERFFRIDLEKIALAA